MTQSFRRNGARAWMLRVLAAYVLVLLVAVALVAAVATGAAGPDARPAQLLGLASPLNLALNLAILAAFAAGVVLVVAWLGRAAREESCLNVFWRDNAAVLEGAAPGPSLLRRLRLENVGASAVRERVEQLVGVAASGGRADVSALAEALLDREEPRVAVARWTAGTLVLLGLLGTFVGLLLTIGSVSDVVDALEVTPDADYEAFLGQLKEGLRSPLEGMSLAFSTSLLGLASSLVLGIGALGLSAAQASWTSKLEQLTALWLAPGLPTGPAAAAPAVSDASLERVDIAARKLADVHGGTEVHVERLEAAGSRLASGVEDFRDRVAGLVSQIERVETLLARVADTQGGGREVLNDIGVKLADLAGATAAVRAEIRDGNDALTSRLRASGDGLREGMAAALAELSADATARRHEARESAILLARIADVLEESARTGGS